jgi:hypothetical protein
MPIPILQGDRMQYLSEPQYVLQQYLRRAPPGHSRSQVLRSAYADAAMEPFQGVAKIAQEVLDKSDSFEVSAAGDSAQPPQHALDLPLAHP